MRLALSLLAAALITLSLFYIMQSLISEPGKRIDKPDPQAGIRFVPAGQVVRTRAASAGPPMPAPPAPPAPPPPIAMSAAQLPARVSDEPVPAPAPPPPMASMPELPRIEPGARPYLGPYAKLPKKKNAASPATDTVAKTRPRAKPRKPPKVAEKKTAPVRPEKKRVVKSPAKPASTLVRHVRRPAVETPKPAASMRPGRAEPRASAGGSGIPGAPDVAVGAAAGAPGTPGGSDSEEVLALMKTMPRYPRKAARSGKEGWVKIEFTITEKGKVANPRVISSKPRRIFDRAALKAIRQWRFRPKSIDGSAVPRRAVQIIEFKLDG